MLFARLGVFVGGFTLEAAEAVCDAELDTVASLVDKNLIRRDGERLGMLETIHEFALEKLMESEERGAMGRRHAEYYLVLAHSANLTIEAEGEMRHDLVIGDWDNVQSALEWALQSGEIEFGLELASAVENYWVTNNPREGRRWITRLLEQAGALRGPLRALALRAAANSTGMLGEAEEATRLYQASLAEYRHSGDERGIGVVLQRMASMLGRDERDQARALLTECLRLHRKVRFARGESVSLGLLGTLELDDGKEEIGLELLQRSASTSEDSGFIWAQASWVYQIAETLVQRGRVTEAEAYARQTLDLATRMGYRRLTILGLTLLARVSAETGQLERAGRLWGAIESEEARSPVGQWQGQRAEHEYALLAHAGPDFERGRLEGGRLTLSEAVDEALIASPAPQ